MLRSCCWSHPQVPLPVISKQRKLHGQMITYRLLLTHLCKRQDIILTELWKTSAGKPDPHARHFDYVDSRLANYHPVKVEPSGAAAQVSPRPTPVTLSGLTKTILITGSGFVTKKRKHDQNTVLSILLTKRTKHLYGWYSSTWLMHNLFHDVHASRIYASPRFRRALRLKVGKKSCPIDMSYRWRMGFTRTCFRYYSWVLRKEEFQDWAARTTQNSLQTRSQ